MQGSGPDDYGAPDMLETYLYRHPMGMLEFWVDDGGIAGGGFKSSFRKLMKSVGKRIGMVSKHAKSRAKAHLEDMKKQGKTQLHEKIEEGRAQAEKVARELGDSVIDKESEVQAAPVPVPAPAPEPEVASAPVGFKVAFKESDIEAVAEEGQFLLDLAEAQGVEINYACREGSCGCCITKLLSGTVEMEENELSDEDRDAGMIYACVSRSTSDVSLEA